MIELYQLANSAAGMEIEEALKELVLAHQVITVKSGETFVDLPANTPLPALKDEGKIITGQDELKTHLRYLEQVAEDWRRFQSDSCYIDADGEHC